MVASGARRSCPSTPRNKSLAVSDFSMKDSIDSARAWSIASLKRTIDSPGSSVSPPAANHRRSTVARRARNSAASWIMENWLVNLRPPCVVAAVARAAPAASPRDLVSRIGSDW
jgi:hypothetical protein